MKKIYSISFSVLVSFILLSGKAFSQWQQTSGPGGGLTTALYAKGDTLFAGNFEHYTLANTNLNAGTLYRSFDHGQRWFKDSTGFYGVPNAFAVNGSTVFVSTSTDGIFRSLDNGSTWSPLQGTNALSPQKLLYVNGILYVGRVIDGISLSTDNGNTFIHSTKGLPTLNSPGVTALGAVGNTVFIGLTSFDPADVGIYRSSNNGASWQLVKNGFVTSFATNGNRLFAVIGETVYASDDLGTTWTLSNTGIPTYPANTETILSIGDTLYASVLINTGEFLGWIIYKSIDNGNSWAPTDTGIPTSEHPFELVHIGNEVFAGTGDFGSVYRTVNAGQSWEPANIGLANVDTRTIFQSGNKLISGSFSNASVHISSDGDNTWLPSDKGLPSTYRIVKTFTQNSKYLFAGMDQLGIFRSKDSGKNWESAANGLDVFGLYVNSLTTKGKYVFAGTYDDVYRSDDNGNTWTKAKAVFGARREIRTVVANDNYVFAGVSAYFGIFRSADNGNSWQEVNTGLPGLVNIYQIIVRGNDLIAATGGGIYISTDNGNHWTRKVNGFANNYNTRTVAAKGDTLVTAIYDQNYFLADGIYLSTDNGNNWQRFDKNIEPFAVNYLAISGNYVFAATETESVWKAALSGSGCSEIITTSTSNITSTSAKLNWTVSGSADTYQIKYGKSTTNTTTVNTTNTSYTVTNLQPSTTYGWQVRAKCGTTYSAWSAINKFKTSASFIASFSNEDAKQRNKFSVYPNPAKNNLSVQFYTAVQSSSSIIITDMQGKFVLQKTFTADTGNNNFNVDISNLSSGNYILSLQNGNDKMIQKIVKQ